MPRSSTTYRCGCCGASARRWVGRCPACAEWNSLEARPAGREHAASGPGGVPGGPAGDPVPLATVDPDTARPRSTGVGELDRVLAGGLVPGSVTLVYGEPGVGKSTLLLQVLLAAAAASGRPVLLASAEESAAQVRVRASRLGSIPPPFFVVAGADVVAVEEAVATLVPELVVVDSVQALADPAVSGLPGSVSQVKACADRLSGVARRHGVAVVLVGHVTKDGGLAGPRTLEHLVDTVLSFEGDRHHALRLLRAVKHRFGPTGEVGLFEMGEDGLRAVADPGPLLLGDRRPEVPGSAITALLHGRRPLVVEIQALAYGVGPGGAGRTAQGVDPRRLATVVAVLECRAGVATASMELFVSATAGIRAVEPASDLPVSLAVASAARGVALPADLVSFGEIGLAGEVRQVPGADRRLAEAGRLGFTRALVPASTPDGPRGLTLFRVGTVTEALDVALRLRDRDTGDVPALSTGTMRSWPNPAAIR
ncbi:MAG: DNA repair protein RadA [Acidimicrobiales bacterium]